MYLRSITIKGFKSFPDRTKLEFAEGVSVIVGPNGSGKSNVTDAVLWALGEQSPLAVRGQTMQDVIFSGGHGLPSRNAAEVEVVLDNSDRGLNSEFAEISIGRRLERSGEGGYTLNGARCRLVDVMEVLSDTGLGKEMHSVVSQGRVEGIIDSRPGDRRRLIEEAAGLGKHRKRRRRAELKLQRTGENLARSLDVEREARTRLRPLKRQAEAAELHERLERQSLEARFELARDAARTAAADLSSAEEQTVAARAQRAEAETRLAAVAARREAAEEAFAAHGRAREALSERLFAATAAVDRIDVRLERVRELAQSGARSAKRARAELERLDRPAGDALHPAGGERPGAAGVGGPMDRIASLEAELGELDAAREERLSAEVARLEADCRAARERRDELEPLLDARRADLDAAEQRSEAGVAARRSAEAALDAARSERARSLADLAELEHLANATMRAPGGAGSLGQQLRVDSGYELAVAAVLGPLLRAGLTSDVDAAGALLDSGDGRGGSILVEAGERSGGASALPAPGAERLLEHVRALPGAAGVVERLLADVWVVDSLNPRPEGFTGVLVTRAGRAFLSTAGELRQAGASGDERALAHLADREELVARAARAEQAVATAEVAVEAATEAAGAAGRERDAAERAVREARRELDDAIDGVRSAERALERRRAGGEQDPDAARRAQLSTELAVERRMAERAEREHRERHARVKRLHGALERQCALTAAAERALPVLATALDAVAAHRESLHATLAADAEAGAGTGSELRACAREEAELQGLLKRAGDEVTRTEVRAQQVRDSAADARAEVDGLSSRLGLSTEAVIGAGASSEAGTAEETAPTGQGLSQERRTELEGRSERLARRREQLGVVNPLAKDEYEEAIAHVEELEAQRGDLESALGELEGIIRETDRRIRESFEETFEATARNFEEVVEHLFPGGRGRLRLVSPDAPRPVIGGQTDGLQEEAAEVKAEADEGEDGLAGGEPGVEVEVTPAGKSTRRLSLLSGGEKSLVALAFLFAVFLARPCPFYVLDEVEAALDDLNIDRFLRLVRSCADRAQFIVVTHQKRTMDAGDRLYGVSMGRDGVSKVVSRKLPAVAGTLDEPVPGRAGVAA